MLYDTDAIRAVVQTLRSHYLQDGSTPLPPLVCDPVCVSTSGHTLLKPDAVQSMIEELFPLASLITPNKSEAELILSHKSQHSTLTPSQSKISSLEDMLIAAKRLLALGPKAVLLKGGHVTTSLADVDAIVAKEDNDDVTVVRGGVLGENMEILQVAEQDMGKIPLVVDVLYDGTHTTMFVRPRIDSTSTHGTGCTLSAALVCALSRGLDRECLSLSPL